MVGGPGCGGGTRVWWGDQGVVGEPGCGGGTRVWWGENQGVVGGEPGCGGVELLIPTSEGPSRVQGNQRVRGGTGGPGESRGFQAEEGEAKT